MANKNDREQADGKHVADTDGTLFGEVLPQSVLEQELWTRRQERREKLAAEGMDEADAALVPLILSLARLAAHRDVRNGSAGELAEGD